MLLRFHFFIQFLFMFGGLQLNIDTVDLQTRVGNTCPVSSHKVEIGEVHISIQIIYIERERIL